MCVALTTGLHIDQERHGFIARYTKTVHRKRLAIGFGQTLLGYLVSSLEGTTC
jgi:hypothetical protein